MQEQIEEKLEEIYRNCIIEVKKHNDNKFYILIEIPYIDERGIIEYYYDYNLTIDYNTDRIRKEIDEKILKMYRR